MTEGPPPAWLKIVASLCGMIKGGNANVQFIAILWVQWRIDIPFLSHSQIKIARSHPGSSILVPYNLELYGKELLQQQLHSSQEQAC